MASVIISRLFEGFEVNCQLFVLTLLFSLPLGLVIAFGSMSRFKPLAWLVRVFVWIIRGTPLMLQLLIIFLGPGLMGWGNPWPGGPSGRLIAATVGFVINYACYFSEIYRGGIQSIPRGQYEAGEVLGMTRSQIFFKITLLQVVKRILPPHRQRGHHPGEGHLSGPRHLLRGDPDGGAGVHLQGAHLAAVLHGAVFPGLRGRADHPLRLAGAQAGLL